MIHCCAPQGGSEPRRWLPAIAAIALGSNDMHLVTLLWSANALLRAGCTEVVSVCSAALEGTVGRGRGLARAGSARVRAFRALRRDESLSTGGESGSANGGAAGAFGGGNEGGNSSSEACLPECGDGIAEAPEECDLGTAQNDGSYGGCTPDCRYASFCGDGVVDAPDEECDDDDEFNAFPYTRLPETG